LLGACLDLDVLERACAVAYYLKEKKMKRVRREQMKAHAHTRKILNATFCLPVISS
jgi:hypothetical protein